MKETEDILRPRSGVANCVGIVGWAGLAGAVLLALFTLLKSPGDTMMWALALVSFVNGILVLGLAEVLERMRMVEGALVKMLKKE